MKKVLIIPYLFLFFSLIESCTNNRDSDTKLDQTYEIEKINQVKAKQIIDTGCVVCHSATASEENRLAPPLEGVKRRYLENYPEIEDFTTAMVDFLLEPSQDKAIMFGAVERFDVMLPMAYSEADLKAVVTYMYQFELDRPDWFEEHYQESHSNRGKGLRQGMQEGGN